MCHKASRCRVALALILAIGLAGPAVATYYEVYLEGFTDNALTQDIAYVRMYVHMDQTDILNVYACGVGSACQGWFTAPGFSFRNGASVWLPIHDPSVSSGADHVTYPLQDGLLLWVDCSTFGTGVSMVTFWQLDDVGDFEANEYPGLVSVSEEGEGRITFEAAAVPNTRSTWGGVKALYR